MAENSKWDSLALAFGAPRRMSWNRASRTSRTTTRRKRWREKKRKNDWDRTCLTMTRVIDIEPLWFLLRPTKALFLLLLEKGAATL
jgi:hypothetical protein